MVLWRLISGLLRGIWRVLTVISRAISVLVPLLLVAYVVGVAMVAIDAGQPESVPEQTALLINPVGVLVENRTPRRPLEAFMEGEGGEVLLFHVIRAIEEGAQDERVTALILDLQGLSGPSVSQALEINRAIDLFKDSGKPVIAVGDYYDQSHYLLASRADRVLMHPEGALALYGFGVYRNYFKTFLDNALITMNVFRVGENKSAVEPYLRDDMSESERQVTGRWLNQLWGAYAQTIEEGRGLDAGAVDQFIEEFPDRLEIAGGDAAQLMLEAGFVDELVVHTEQEAILASVVGATDQFDDSMMMSYRAYPRAQSSFIEPKLNGSKPSIAVVTIEGELVPGDSTRGFAGSDTVVEQLDMAASIDGLAAVVLRINSPGGSVFASDVIRNKVLEVKAAGIPIVVSMASMAASGGYYIAADADEIWALPSTLTGSIGVFAAFPTLERLYDWAGVSVDGVGTSPLANAIRLDTGVDPLGVRIINAVLANVYDDFVGLVATGRSMSWDAVDAIAGGVVWSGTDARDVGLVDELGGLDQAVASAAVLAGAEDWRVRRIGTPIDPSQQIFEELGDRLGGVRAPVSGLVSDLAAQLSVPLHLADSLQDPRNVYLRCLECAGGI